MIGRLKNAAREEFKYFKESRLYQILKRAPILRRAKLATGKLLWKVFPYNYPLHADPVIVKSFRHIISKYNITSIVETGTFLGSTTSLLASLFPNLHIYTCEINRESYLKARENLSKYKNVHIFHGTSPDFLKKILPDKSMGKRPLFYLDAHWLDDWPLE